MIVAAIVVLLGLLFGIVAVQVWELRLSGVIVVPLLAVYTLSDFQVLPIFALSVVTAYVGLAVLRQRTLLYGRSLLLAGIGIGAAVPLLSLSVPPLFGVRVLLQETTVIGSVLPGIAAYNYHQLEGRKRVDDVVGSFAALTGLVVLGGALINPSTAATIGSVAPPILFRATSDIAVFRGAVVPAPDTLSVVSLPIELFALLFGIGASELVYARWGVRINGLIAVPLLVLFSLAHAVVIPLYVIGTLLVYGTITFLNWQTLLYGRVLLSAAIIVGVVLAIPTAIYGPAVPGTLIIFTAILAGIGAYNLHRVPPRERTTSAIVSAGLFIAVLAAIEPVVTPAPASVLSSVGMGHIVLGAVVCMLAAAKIAALERRRQPATRTVNQDAEVLQQ